MRAITIPSFGGPEVLTLSERDVPKLAPGEILIKVLAAGVSRPDVLQRRGLYPPPPGASDVPGLEVAGIISDVAGISTTDVTQDFSDFSIGDAVVALVSGGGYAEYCTAPRAQVLPLPAGLTFVQGASIPENFFTVFSNVWMRAQLRPGESFLVHGGTSGIGSTAIILAKALGARVFATAGGADKCAVCARMGAERAFDRHREDFVSEIKAATSQRGVDVILDMVGGTSIARDLEALAVDGRIAVIAFLEAATASIPLPLLMQKRATLTGSTLRNRSWQDKGRIAQSLKGQVWPLLANGTVVPWTDTVFPLERVVDAHTRIDSGEHMGKIVLSMGPEAYHAGASRAWIA